MSAPVTIGPRQMSACSGSTRKPIDMVATPWAWRGSSFWPSREVGRCESPVSTGIDGP